MQPSTFAVKIYLSLIIDHFLKNWIGASHILLCDLLITFCILVLLPISKSETNTIDFACSITLFLIFKVKEKSVLKLCLFFVNACLRATDLKYLNVIQKIIFITQKICFICFASKPRPSY